MSREVSQLKNILHKLNLSKCLEGESLAVCGGTLTSIFTNQKVNDIDLFLLNKNEIYRISEKLNIYKYKNVYQTKNAITFKNPDKEIPIQLITNDRYFAGSSVIGRVNTILDKFDFTICMAGFDLRDETLEVGSRFFSDLCKKELVYNAFAINPSASFIRLKKYLDRGFTISAFELLKMAISISSIEPITSANIEERISGLNALSMSMLIQGLNSNPEELKLLLNSSDLYDASGHITGNKVY